MITQELALCLCEIRRASGMTQQELATASGVSRWSINQFEKGRQTISVDNLAKLCEALDAEIIIRYNVGRE